jgi:hypothetical protein
MNGRTPDYLLRFRPLPSNVPPAVRLRALLKHALRTLELRCIWARVAQPDEETTMADAAVLDAISRFDREYQPSDAPKQRAGIDTLPDGDHDFEVADASLEMTAKTQEPILRVGLRVVSGAMRGSVVEKAYFFSNQMCVDILGADLVTLGFDADRWTAANGRRFSVELGRVVPQLVGVRFRGHKRMKNNYANLYVNARLAPGSQPHLPASPAPVAAGAGNYDEIPF